MDWLCCDPWRNRWLWCHMVTARVYIVGALVVLATFLGLTATVFYYRAAATSARADAATAKANADTLAAVNGVQTAAIARLTALRDADDALLRDVRSRLDTIASNAQAQTAALKQLEASNADVKAYLSQSIPPDLACLLTGEDCNANVNRDGPSPGQPPK